MRERAIYLVCLVSCLMGSQWCLAESQKSPPFRLYISEYPPFCFTQDDKATGVGVDIVQEILHRLDLKATITSLPWKRAYIYLSKKPDVMLFTVTRTPERESLFQWVGPVITAELVLFAKRGSKLNIQTLDDAKQVKSIGTVQGYSAEKWLRSKGFTNIDTIARDDRRNVLKLMPKRISLWACVNISGFFIAKQARFDPAELKIVYKLVEQPKYIAYSKAIPKNDIQEWQRILDEMKQDGTYDKIMSRWIQ